MLIISGTLSTFQSYVFLKIATHSALEFLETMEELNELIGIMSFEILSHVKRTVINSI